MKMQIEMTQQQANIVKQMLDQHTQTVDNHLKSEKSSNLAQDERRVITTGCKIMKELALQIGKKMEKC
jgi:chitinase